MKYTVIGENSQNDIIAHKFDNYNEAKLKEYELSIRYVEYIFTVKFSSDAILCQLMSSLVADCEVDQ